MSVVNTAIVYSVLGLIIGIALAAVVCYAFPLGKLKHKNHQLRDACLLYQKQLTQLLNKNKALEIQVRDVKQQLDRQQSENRKLAEASAAAGAGANTVETPAVAAGTDGDGVSSSPELQKAQQRWDEEILQLRGELEQLQTDRQMLEASLGQASDRWKQEREVLLIENKRLQDKLKALNDAAASAKQPAATLDADSSLAEMETKLKEQQAAWKRAQHLLQSQLTKLKTDKKALETELVSQVNQSEREKQALEDEIELLTERMMKLQILQQVTDQIPTNPPANVTPVVAKSGSGAQG